MGSIDPAVWLGSGYAVFLLVAAHLLDLTARRTAVQSNRWHTGGFTYHPRHDAWVCPEDQWLWPTSFDPDNRVMRYRGTPSICNACPLKSVCTTSENGRQISRNIDPWPSSEAEKFHRGIACAVVVLALLWPLATMLGPRTPLELVILGATVVFVALGSWPLWSHFRRTPTGFPLHVPVEGLDESIAGAQASGLREGRRKAVYASTRRTGPVPVTIEKGPPDSDRHVNPGGGSL
ncbi:hypothetical protein [Cryobacterium adonitolivorans]|uniref:hypothetical protein n=1 Tax=Cryobacterium adonitolivorans TaxID=1259189 RepID=UPI00158438CB|nr:hypothetical protein [Cryobacterium adonitolivorans]